MAAINVLNTQANFDNESELYYKLEFINSILLKDSPFTGVNFSKILDENPEFTINHNGVIHKIGYVIGGSHGINAIYNNSNFLKVNNVHSSFINPNSHINSNEDFFNKWKRLDMDLLIKSFDCDLHLFIDTHTDDGKGIDILTDIIKNNSKFVPFITDTLNIFFDRVTEHINKVFTNLFLREKKAVSRSEYGYYFDFNKELKKHGYRLGKNSDDKYISYSAPRAIKRKHLDSLGQRNSNIFGRIFYSLVKIDAMGNDVIDAFGRVDTTLVVLYDVAWERAFKVLPIENCQANNVMKYHHSYQVKYYDNNNRVSIVMFSLYDIIKNYVSLIEQPNYRKRQKAILRLYFIMSILKNKELLTEEIKKEILDNPTYKSDIIIVLEKIKSILNQANLITNPVFNEATFINSYRYIYNSDADPTHFSLPFILDDDNKQNIRDTFNNLFFQIDNIDGNYIINYGENVAQRKGYNFFIEVINEIIAGFNDNSLLQPTPIETITMESCVAKFREYIDDNIIISGIPETQRQIRGLDLIEKYKSEKNELDNFANVYRRIENPAVFTYGTDESEYIKKINKILSHIKESKYICSPGDINKYFIVYCPLSYSYNSDKYQSYLKKTNNLNPHIYFHPGFIYGTIDYNKFIKNIHRNVVVGVLLVRYSDIFYVKDDEILLPLGTNFLVLDNNYLKYNKNETNVVYGIVRQTKIINTLNEFKSHYDMSILSYFDIEPSMGIIPSNFNSIIPASGINDYILSNISPYNNIFRIDQTVINPSIIGITIPKDTKLFSNRSTDVWRSSIYSTLNTIQKPSDIPGNNIEFRLKENSFYINIMSLFNLDDKYDSINFIKDLRYDLSEKDIISIFDIKLIGKIGVDIEKKIDSFKDHILILHNTIAAGNILRAYKRCIIDLETKFGLASNTIKGVYIPSHLSINYNGGDLGHIEFISDQIISIIPSTSDSTEFDNTGNIFFSGRAVFTSPDIIKKQDLISNELKIINNFELNSINDLNLHHNLKSVFRLDIQTLGLSSLLKDFNDEKRFRELFDFIQHNSIPIAPISGGENNKYYKKYLKYKNKYLYLKNKQ